MEIKQRIEIELRTQIDEQFGARVDCEDWERLQQTNPVIKAALIAMNNIYTLAKSESEASVGDGWIEIDIESENYPSSFQDCWLFDINKKVSFGYMLKYGDDITNAEWSFRDSNEGDMPFDFVTHYIPLYLPQPPQQ